MELVDKRGEKKVVVFWRMLSFSCFPERDMKETTHSPATNVLRILRNYRHGVFYPEIRVLA